MLQATFEQRFSWVRRQMPRVQNALQNLPDLTGVRLACSMHLDLKMLPLVEGLLNKGAALFVTTCNPTTVRNEVVDAMKQWGAQAEAWQGMSTTEYQAAIRNALEWEPTHLCEMGADFTYALAQSDNPETLSHVRASLEATGSGINRLCELTVPYPIFNWDDLPVKEGLHNRHMVGLTTWQAFLAQTLLSLHEKRVLVIGYGSVGRGVAASARAFGGTVMVTERDPARLAEARYDGWWVMPWEEALKEADVIVTVTGAEHVIAQDHFPLLKSGVFLLNSGHRANEIEVSALRTYPSERLLPQVEAFQVEEKTVYLFAGGSMANLTAGEGDSINAFDTTLAVMISGIGHIVGEGSEQEAGVYLLPKQVWEAAIQ